MSFFCFIGNCVPMKQKTLREGSHCGGTETAAHAPRRRRRILQSRILFLQKAGKMTGYLQTDRESGKNEKCKDFY